MDLVITGAAGFLGSHLLLDWIKRNPGAKILCIARGQVQESPYERMVAALKRAARECGEEFQTVELMKNLTVIDADLKDSNWNEHPQWREWLINSHGFDVIHSAANLSFEEKDREDLLQTNVIGTKNFFHTFKGLTNVRSFNYVSTAYVAGNIEGTLPECRNERPGKFTNPYEESKWLAEGTVQEISADLKIGIRILRPSIIIGHSKTLSISAKTGLYKVIEILFKLGRHSTFGSVSVEIPSKSSANLNFMPVDLVVAEMLDVIHARERTINQVFHLTNEKPISTDDALFCLSQLLGISLKTCSSDNIPKRPTNRASNIVVRGLGHYLPYFSQVRTFDRQNVHACGAGRHQRNYWLDSTRFHSYTKAFIESEAASLS